MNFKSLIKFVSRLSSWKLLAIIGVIIFTLIAILFSHWMIVSFIAFAAAIFCLLGLFIGIAVNPSDKIQGTTSGETPGEQKQQALHLSLRHSIAQLLAASTYIEEAIPEVLNILGGSLGLDVGILWEVDEEQHALICLKTWCKEKTEATTRFVELTVASKAVDDEGLPGRVWKSKKPELIENIPANLLAANAGLHSAFAFPLIYDDKVVGIYEFYRQSTGPMDPSFVDTLSSITSQLGIFIARERSANLLKKTKEAAEETSRIKSEFLANMSHELRTPLNAVIGYGEMLLEDAEQDGLAKYSDSLKKIIISAKHLLQLINDVLDVSKIEADKMKLFLEDINIKEFAIDLETNVVPLMLRNQNTYQLQIADDLGMMHTDVVRLKQSLLNLLSNASKFTKNGTIILNIKPLIKDEKQWVKFSVIDTGIGIPQEKIEKLFQAFTQVDASTTREYGGTGLGLYLTKRFCEMLGGWVTLESTVGKGSTFSILLPLKSSVGIEKPTHAASVPTIAAIPEPKRKKVLVIDDSLMFHEEVRIPLEKSGFTVIHAYNGQEGLDLARQHQPNIITLDVVMPSMDGWSVLTTLKSDPMLSKIPVMLVTVMPEQNFGYALGAVDYLSKPVNPDQLVSKIRHLASNGKMISILLVDDDHHTREIIQKSLSKYGWKIVEAANGRQALNQLATFEPTAILLDLMMPEMDGFAFLKEIELDEKWRRIPIIILTAKDLSEEERSYLVSCTKNVFKKGSQTGKDLAATICKQINSLFETEKH